MKLACCDTAILSLSPLLTTRRISLFPCIFGLGAAQSSNFVVFSVVFHGKCPNREEFSAAKSINQNEHANKSPVAYDPDII